MTESYTGAGMDEAKPLSGKRIVVTRARPQASAFSGALARLGAEAIEFPTIEIAAPESYEPLDRALGQLAAYDWIIFTSVNGVNRFAARMGTLDIPARAAAKAQLAAIGPETAKALGALGLTARVVPGEYRAEAILDEIGMDAMRGKKVLVPRAAEARDVLIETLREWGAIVDVVAAYRTIPGASDTGRMRALFEAGKIDVVTFTSSSTVKNFAALFPAADMTRLLAQSAVACIGPITEESARAIGIRVDVVAEEYTIAGLTTAIVEYFGRQQATGNRQ